ncbi:MAG: hypothetical protein HQK54_17075 [Oligoflexales bacterium]|nr:hypothetical protein [Oligoflexales bacterium]
MKYLELKKITKQKIILAASLASALVLILFVLVRCSVEEGSECLPTAKNNNCQGTATNTGGTGSTTTSSGGNTDSAATTKPQFTNTAVTISQQGPHGAVVGWERATDNKTAQADLLYRVVYSLSADNITITSADTPVPSNVILKQDWTKDITSLSLSDLSASTDYYVAVFAKDGDGEVSMIGPQKITTSSDGSPTTGTAIAFSSTTATSVTVSWGAATDDVTPAASLKYRLVRASTTTAIDTVAEVAADTLASDVTLVVDWTAALTSKAVTSLASATSYAFAVAVKDDYGNKGLYTPATMTTLDSTAPTIGTTLAASSVSDYTLTIGWGEASDNLTAKSKLKYRLVKASSSEAIDTIAEVDAISGADLLMDYTEATLSKNVTSLSQNTQYYFSVVVQDEAGNKAIYTPISSTTTNDFPVAGTLSNLRASQMQEGFCSGLTYLNSLDFWIFLNPS